MKKYTRVAALAVAACMSVTATAVPAQAAHGEVAVVKLTASAETNKSSERSERSDSSKSSELDDETKETLAIVGGLVGLLVIGGIIHFATPHVIQFLQANGIFIPGITPPPAREPQGMTQRERDYAAQFMRELNAYRASRGLRPVVEDKNLSNGAYEWSKHMHRTGRFVHATGGNFGENIYHAQGGYINDPSSAINAWKHSPGHNRNMLDPNARFGGIGFYIRDDKAYATYRFTR
ncbi:CAP domain-containing protein [Corynebacterium aquatimens]|uniref:Uncharacterized protein YkwD n=1 Tax=Corynebacterium aquatimens TaxID=1190508 RepID=A0A931DWM8_9CORY|nr:CAP domain-containing protein [Corynebacterium aquatimens]MBG6122889.1 uncharacterized protein YkwD [Corynebacterium aquatimens]WJY66776.1 Cysteine-rich secretory protein family protein [Corynebacterium aquatimens]